MVDLFSYGYERSELTCFEVLYLLNPLINRIIPDNLDISCNVDSDCRLAVPLELSRCRLCDAYDCKSYNAEDDKVIAINKDWKPRCFFSKPKKYICLACIGGINIKDYETECQNNKCIKIKK